MSSSAIGRELAEGTERLLEILAVWTDGRADAELVDVGSMLDLMARCCGKAEPRLEVELTAGELRRRIRDARERLAAGKGPRRPRARRRW